MTKHNRGKRKSGKESEEKTTHNTGLKRAKSLSRKNQREHADSDDDYSEHLAKILDVYTSQLLGETGDERKGKNLMKQKEEVLEKEAKPASKIQSKTTKKDVEVVVFQSRKRKIKEKEPTRDDSLVTGTITDVGEASFATKYSDKRLNSSEVLEKLKFDVGLFGMRAFSKEQQREQERQRAIKLGAAPPKKDYINYKLLMEKRKQEKEKREAGEPSDKKQNSSDRKRKMKPAFWTEGNKSFTPQIGKYKDGVLKISSKDIKSLNRKR